MKKSIKKRILTSVLVLVFAVGIPLAANAYQKVICGNMCSCEDYQDELAWAQIFCNPV